MVLGPWRPWWRRSWARSAAAVVCHESGHCLGLWHREDHGIMAGGRRPDDHDLKSIRDYYL
jgi:predicted Zn-dependent protease